MRGELNNGRGLDPAGQITARGYPIGARGNEAGTRMTIMNKRRNEAGSTWL